MSSNNINVFLILETLTSSYKVVFSTSLHSLLSSCIKIVFLLLLTTWLDIICVFARFYCSLLYNESSIVVVQSFSRVQLFVTACTPGFPVLHRLPELAQAHVHCVNDAIQPSHPLSPPSPALNLSQHQGPFQWVIYSHQVTKVLDLQFQHRSFQIIFRVDFL